MQRATVVTGVEHQLNPRAAALPVAAMMQGYASVAVSPSLVTIQAPTPCLNGVGSSTAQRFLGRDGAMCIKDLETAVDIRKRELLEARLINEKGTSHETYSNSNLCVVSQLNGFVQSDESGRKPGLLENVKTMSGSSGKKRKRKSPVDVEINGTEGSSQNEATCNKISDFFKQTEMTLSEIDVFEGKVAADVSRKDATISKLESERDELHKQLTTQQRSIEKNSEVAHKCRNVAKALLIEKSRLERKTARQKCMENRLRLGQFVTQRQGALFAENWVDGFAFNDLTKKQQHIAQEREDVEKQRKLLNKRKPLAAAGFNKAQRSSKESDIFVKPSDKSLTACEFYEQDEILKLRAAATKKEDLDLQVEAEKLEQEKNAHVREIRRIHSEDSSRFNEHQVLHERYLLLNLLGKGGSSEIHKGFDLVEQRYVACKVHQLNRDWKEERKNNYIKHAVRECNFQMLLDHPRIVRLFDVFEIDSNSFCAVLEYCDGSDLEFYLKQNKVISEKETRSVIIQMVRALNEIKPPVIHYDLKPGNVLLSRGSGTGDIKITDFGLCKAINGDDIGVESERDLASRGAGTYWYLPPECFVLGKDLAKISSKVDVWSLGVIFYQCIYGKKPFGNELSQAAFVEENAILKATEVQFPCKPLISNEAKSFIRRCLTYSKDLRPDVLTLAQDEYLRTPILKSKRSLE